MKRILTITASAFAVASVGATALAGDPAAAPQYAPASMTDATEKPDPLAVATKQDAKAYAKAEFARIDANADGVIEKAEFVAVAEAAQAERAAMNEDALAQTETVMAEGDVEMETAEQQFIGLAAGGETVSKEQLVEARLADFTTADVNGDGRLEGEEQQRFAEIVEYGAVGS